MLEERSALEEGGDDRADEPEHEDRSNDEQPHVEARKKRINRNRALRGLPPL